MCSDGVSRVRGQGVTDQLNHNTVKPGIKSGATPRKLQTGQIVMLANNKHHICNIFPYIPIIGLAYFSLMRQFLC